MLVFDTTYKKKLCCQVHNIFYFVGNLPILPTNIDSLIPLDWISWIKHFSCLHATVASQSYDIPRIIFGPLPKQPRSCSLEDFPFKLQSSMCFSQMTWPDWSRFFPLLHNHSSCKHRVPLINGNNTLQHIYLGNTVCAGLVTILFICIFLFLIILNGSMSWL